MRLISRDTGRLVVLVVLAVILGLFTTITHVRVLGVDYLERGTQLHRHEAVLEGRAPNPWQYRVLSAHMVDPVLELFTWLGVPHPIASGFAAFRAAQDTTILLLAFLFYRRLGLPATLAAFGVIFLAWGMSSAHFDSDLQFNTFFDIIFYLLAALIMLERRRGWVIPLAVLAALNRETSGLIPLLPLGAAAVARRGDELRRWLPPCAVALLGYVLVFVGLRIFLGGRPLFIPYGHEPGLDLLWYNMSRAITWERILATVSVVPVIALIGYRVAPLLLRGLFWVIVPIWLTIHTMMSVIAETRLLLVPQALVFIPMALWAVHVASITDGSTPPETLYDDRDDAPASKQGQVWESPGADDNQQRVDCSPLTRSRGDNLCAPWVTKRTRLEHQHEVRFLRRKSRRRNLRNSIRRGTASQYDDFEERETKAGRDFRNGRSQPPSSGGISHEPPPSRHQIYSSRRR